MNMNRIMQKLFSAIKDKSIEKDVGEFETMFENYRDGNYAAIIKDLQKKCNKTLKTKITKNGKKRN